MDRSTSTARPLTHRPLASAPVRVAGKAVEIAPRRATPADAGNPWARFTTATSDGMHMRVASSRRDAEGIRDVIRSAWRVDDGEPYFYALFNDPEAVFRTVIAPALETSDLGQLDVLCLVIEDPTAIASDGAPGRIVATASLVLDHARREIELGRAGVSNDVRGNNLLAEYIPMAKRLLALLPDYVVIADATTLVGRAGAFAGAMGAIPVALHPSSFTVQRSCVSEWITRLSRRHDAEVARALLYRSPDTGLGRFMTAYHRAVPAHRAAYAPALTAAQGRFYQYTSQALGPMQSLGPQPSTARAHEVHDQVHTGTRIVRDPRLSLRPLDAVRDAAAAGMETLIIQVPCHPESMVVSSRLERAGGLLGGVFPDARGQWYASYTFFTSAVHRIEVMHNLRKLRARKAIQAQYQALLDLMLDTETACSIARVQQIAA
ncbi:hypothetical protein [Haliangium sp.]|uniref:hypothetical protein n=1 Tax=Haliangium sp. TaxID=2663208 RepID=UPI003D1308B0